MAIKAIIRIMVFIFYLFVMSIIFKN